MSFRRRIALASAAAVGDRGRARVGAHLPADVQPAAQPGRRRSCATGRATAGRLQRYPETGRQARRRTPSATANAWGSTSTGSTATRADEADATARAGRTRRLAAALRPGARGTCSASCRRGPTRCAAISRSSTTPGTIVVRSARNVSLPVDARDAQRWPSTAASRSSATRTSTACTCACSPSRSAAGRAVQLAQPLTEVDSLLSRLRLILALLDARRHRARRAARPARRGRGGAAAQAPDAGDRARRADAGPQRAHRVGRRRRDRAAGAQLQRDARRAGALDERARRLGARPAPARRRRLARAAHAGHEPAHEHRDPAAGRATWTPSERGRLLERRGRADRGADGADERPDRTRARRRAATPPPRSVRLDVLVGEVVERARRHAPATAFATELAPTVVAGVPARLERAVSNLIDNAAKYSPPRRAGRGRAARRAS